MNPSDSEEELHPLPTTARSFDGVTFNPNDNVWKLRDMAGKLDVKWSIFEKWLNTTLLQNLKHASLWYVENRSLSLARNTLEQLKALLRSRHKVDQNPISTIEPEHISNYLASLKQSEEWKVGVVSGFLSRWSSLGIGGISSTTLDLLNELTLSGNAKGTAVSTYDPHRGPFTVMEAEAIQAAMRDSLATGMLSLADYCLVILMAGLGSRPVQFAALKCKDLRSTTKDGTVTGWILDVPRAKQRNQTARSQLKPRSLHPELAKIVLSQVNSVQEEYARSDPNEMDSGELPIFPNWASTEIPGFAYHATAAELSGRIKKALQNIGAVSERTGKAISITAKRFRYTVGTRAAEEGLGELVIAELLDHSDVQQVAVYVMATQKIVDRIDRSVAMQLAPLAQAFAGQLIESEADATRGNDPSSRIREASTRECVGNCGRFGFCNSAAPLACYTCKRFQAWVDAPHGRVLDQLLDRRERVLKLTGDLTVASINDRTILAVAHVIRLCAERQKSKVTHVS